MKTHPFILSLLAALALVLTGCGSKIDTSSLEKSFAPAEAGLKDASSKAAAAVKQGDYSGALKELQALAGNAKLTDDQKKAIADVIEQVKKALADAGAKAAEGASKAMGDAQKALPK